MNFSCAEKRPLILLQAASAWAFELNAPNCTRCPPAGLGLLATTRFAPGLVAGVAAGVGGAAGRAAGRAGGGSARAAARAAGGGPAAAGPGGAAKGFEPLAVSWKFSIRTRAS